MSRSPHYIRLLNTRRWRQLRQRTIEAASGLCQRCLREGRVSGATEVHHIRPVESVRDPLVMERLAYDPANLMALCHRCHQEIHSEMGKGSREERRKRTQEEVDRFHAMIFGDADTQDPGAGIF